MFIFLTLKKKLLNCHIFFLTHSVLKLYGFWYAFHLVSVNSFFFFSVNNNTKDFVIPLICKNVWRNSLIILVYISPCMARSSLTIIMLNEWLADWLSRMNDGKKQRLCPLWERQESATKHLLYITKHTDKLTCFSEGIVKLPFKKGSSVKSSWHSPIWDLG